MFRRHEQGGALQQGRGARCAYEREYGAWEHPFDVVLEVELRSRGACERGGVAQARVEGWHQRARANEQVVFVQEAHEAHLVGHIRACGQIRQVGAFSSKRRTKLI
jgi:hypothetical protein